MSLSPDGLAFVECEDWTWVNLAHVAFIKEHPVSAEDGTPRFGLYLADGSLRGSCIANSVWDLIASAISSPETAP